MLWQKKRDDFKGFFLITLSIRQRIKAIKIVRKIILIPAGYYNFFFREDNPLLYKRLFSYNKAAS